MLSIISVNCLILQSRTRLHGQFSYRQRQTWKNNQRPANSKIYEDTQLNSTAFLLDFYYPSTTAVYDAVIDG